MRTVKTLEIRVPDEIASIIGSAAQERGVSIEELIRSTLEEKFTPEADFESAVSRVLSKNADLYKRLS